MSHAAAADLPLPLALLIPVLYAAQVALPVLTMAWDVPRRPRFSLRLGLTLGGFLAIWVGANVAANWLTPAAPGPGELAFWRTLPPVVVLVACIPLVTCCFELSVPDALACVVAGYVLQNLASGVMALINAFAAPIQPPWLDQVLQPAFSALVLLALYLPWRRAFVRRARAAGIAGERDLRMLALLVMVALMVIGFDVVIKVATSTGLSRSLVIALRAVHGLTCVFILVAEYDTLYSRRLREDVAVARRLAAERERQYRLSRQNIDAINVKCHDIRHQIRSLGGGAQTVTPGVLDDIAREVNVFDAAAHTGNDALDTIVTEKGLVCEGRGVRLTCMADGTALEGMADADLYSLFGNALENAIDAAAACTDPDRRSVSLTVRRRGGFAVVHVENFFDGEVRMDKDGLPRTTKGDEASHGFGTRSMQQVAERYGGTLSVSAEGGVYRLDVLIPCSGQA